MVIFLVGLWKLTFPGNGWEMLTQIPAQSQPLESALPPPPSSSTPFLIQGFIIDGIPAVERALFTCRVSVVESPQLCGDAALRKTWILSFGHWACGFLPLLSRALPRKGRFLYHRLNVNVIGHTLGPPCSPGALGDSSPAHSPEPRLWHLSWSSMGTFCVWQWPSA